MRKALLKTVLSGGMLWWSLEVPVRAEDRAVTPTPESSQGIKVAVVNGKLVVTNSAPNAPVVVSGSGVVLQAAIQNDDNEMPAHIQSLVDSISKTHGVDPRLVAAVMKVESNFNRWARSAKGALGLMQLVPATGRRFGVEDFFDPAQNIEGGVRYLKFLSEKFGADNIDLQLAAYNAGENVVERLGRVPQIPETVNYVRKIKTIYKPENGPGLVSASDETRTATSPALTPPGPPAPIYSNVDGERGVIRFSNIGPPN